jgi:hypothetical protein
MNKINILKVNGREIVTLYKSNQDYISLTDMARTKNEAEPDIVVSNWMRNRYTIDFLGIWEKLYNPHFNPIEFEGIKNNSGDHSFTLSPSKWIRLTRAIGLNTKSGRYGGGTFAHKDIAFEFASWLSPEFKLYLIKEFQRIKDKEGRKLFVEWDAKRMLTKMNYRIHTDAIKGYLLPSRLSKKQTDTIYANEADLLNMALFGITAQEWRIKNSNRIGNIRDYADIVQLICLANLETLNAEFIHQKISQSDRLIRLNEIAIYQMKSLLKDKVRISAKTKKPPI